MWLSALAAVTEASASAPTSPPADAEARAKAAHALNRLGYGPRPGEVERVAAQGVESWIHAQLRPRKIADPVAEAEVAKLEKIQLPPSALVAAYQEEIRRRQEKQKAAGAGEKAPTGPDAMAGEQARLLVAQAVGELQHARFVRAVFSERQLEQVLVDFWFNHFNVDARKQQVRATVVAYEQDVIRPRVFGEFRDLLGATARSPAMLVYLDNVRSSKEQEIGPREKERQRQALREKMGMSEEAAAVMTPGRRGLNENYGRELLELHTLGVDGGYEQRDVQEVARAFTGWTLDPRTGEFVFRAAWHDTGPKTVLGKSLPSGGGVKDGERVLDLVAAHPATAQRIAYKLCQRFVADQPPAGLVQRVAAVFTESQGDLRQTYEALFLDPEFFAPEFRGAKTKAPFEYAASALRASGAKFVTVTLPRERAPVRALEAGYVLGAGGNRGANLPRKTMLMHTADMGQPLYAWGPPTGFSEDSSHWVSAGALVSRLNFALALTGGQVADARVDIAPLLASADADQPEAVVSALANSVLGHAPSEGTLKVLCAQIATRAEGAPATVDSRKLLALLLGSPEFQRR